MIKEGDKVEVVDKIDNFGKQGIVIDTTITHPKWPIRVEFDEGGDWCDYAEENLKVISSGHLSSKQKEDVLWKEIGKRIAVYMMNSAEHLPFIIEDLQERFTITRK